MILVVLCAVLVLGVEGIDRRTSPSSGVDTLFQHLKREEGKDATMIFDAVTRDVIRHLKEDAARKKEAEVQKLRELIAPKCECCAKLPPRIILKCYKQKTEHTCESIPECDWKGIWRENRRPRCFPACTPFGHKGPSTECDAVECPPRKSCNRPGDVEVEVLPDHKATYAEGRCCTRHFCHNDIADSALLDFKKALDLENAVVPYQFLPPQSIAQCALLNADMDQSGLCEMVLKSFKMVNNQGFDYSLDRQAHKFTEAYCRCAQAFKHVYGDMVSKLVCNTNAIDQQPATLKSDGSAPQLPASTLQQTAPQLPASSLEQTAPPKLPSKKVAPKLFPMLIEKEMHGVPRVPKLVPIPLPVIPDSGKTTLPNTKIPYTADPPSTSLNGKSILESIWDWYRQGGKASHEYSGEAREASKERSRNIFKGQEGKRVLKSVAIVSQKSLDGITSIPSSIERFVKLAEAMYRNLLKDGKVWVDKTTTFATSEFTDADGESLSSAAASKAHGAFTASEMYGGNYASEAHRTLTLMDEKARKVPEDANVVFSNAIDAAGSNMADELEKINLRRQTILSYLNSNDNVMNPKLMARKECRSYNNWDTLASSQLASLNAAINLKSCSFHKGRGDAASLEETFSRVCTASKHALDPKSPLFQGKVDPTKGTCGQPRSFNLNGNNGLFYYPPRSCRPKEGGSLDAHFLSGSHELKHFHLNATYAAGEKFVTGSFNCASQRGVCAYLKQHCSTAQAEFAVYENNRPNRLLYHIRIHGMKYTITPKCSAAPGEMAGIAVTEGS